MNIQRSNVRQISGFKPMEYFVVAVFYPRELKRDGTWRPAAVEAIVDTEHTINDALDVVRERIGDGRKIEFVHRIRMGELPEDITEELVNLANDQIALDAAE